MHRTPAPKADDGVAHLLQAQAAAHNVGVRPGQLDDVGKAEKVGRRQQMDVQAMRLYPLPAIEQAPHGGDPGRGNDTQDALDRLYRAHLIGHRANAADARHQNVTQMPARQRPRLGRRSAVQSSAFALQLVCRGRRRREQGQQFFPRRRPGRKGVILIEFSEAEIEALTRLRSVPRGCAKAGCGRVGAVHRDEQEILAPRGAMPIGIRAEKMAILQRKRDKVAGPHADHGRRAGRYLRHLHLEACPLALHAPERLDGSERQRLEGLRAVGPGEAALPGARLQAKTAGGLPSGPFPGQFGRRRDFLVNNGAVARNRPHDTIAQPFQDVEKSRPGEKGGWGHGLQLDER